MITLLTLMAAQPALAESCEPKGVVAFYGEKAPSDSDIRSATGTRQFFVENQEYDDLAPIRVAIGSSPHFVALVADGDDFAPATDCDCRWDLDIADDDESSIFQSDVSIGTGDTGDVENDVELARYLAPVDLVACESEERVLLLKCEGSDWERVKLEIAPSSPDGSPLEDDQGNAIGWKRCSVQGGGCLSPQRVGDPIQSAVWLLFPLIGLGGLARRRD